ncbi:maleylpyruvate isomerase family mycothiol-dependent enzyme [Phytomonospora sp. NPDC050363]|uniref:maleylpyruvate isomerase family mycothiol-dependent enzyme n=1 Tax=Phytomonospora sp. NPDC050363 TaxID=3155642 RepID=UPI0033F9227C
MEWSRYTASLTADAARLAEVVDGHMDAKVPSCPEWTVTDLVHHLGEVYEHKTLCIKYGAEPQPWPPERPTTTPLTRMRTALGHLLAEFTGRAAASPAYTWYEPDQTVGFWARRMAMETAVHRVDAELAAGVEITPIPEEIAVDGVDEILNIFFAWAYTRWPEECAPVIADGTGEPVVIATGDREFTVRVSPESITVTEGEEDVEAAARVSGDPTDVLLWLWRRVPDEKVTIEGDAEEAGRLHRMLASFTQ